MLMIVSILYLAFQKYILQNGVDSEHGVWSGSALFTIKLHGSPAILLNIHINSSFISPNFKMEEYSLEIYRKNTQRSYWGDRIYISAVFYKGDSICNFMFANVYIKSPFKKGSINHKRKGIALFRRRQNSFGLRKFTSVNWYICRFWYNLPAVCFFLWLHDLYLIYYVSFNWNRAMKRSYQIGF